MNLKQRFNSIFYCPFWSCQPPENGTWWQNGGDTLHVRQTPKGTLVPVAEKVYCEKCGRRI